MDLAGWTNDRLVADRIARLPQSEWVYGRPNASIVMAAFLHVAPGGMRFNGPELGAWYAAAALPTAVAEVAHHLRREAVAVAKATLTRQYRAYVARLEGDYLDLRGQAGVMPDVFDPLSYAASQALGEEVRARGDAGLLYGSLRHAGGENIVVHRPPLVLDVVQADHFEIKVEATAPRIEVRRLVA